MAGGPHDKEPFASRDWVAFDGRSGRGDHLYQSDALDRGSPEFSPGSSLWHTMAEPSASGSSHRGSEASAFAASTRAPSESQPDRARTRPRRDTLVRQRARRSVIIRTTRVHNSQATLWANVNGSHPKDGRIFGTHAVVYGFSVPRA